MISSKVKFLIAFTLFVCIIFFGYSFLRDYLKGVAFKETMQKEAALLEKDKAFLEQFTGNATAENKKSYIEQVSMVLEGEELSDWTRGILLIRKALALSLPAGEAPGGTEMSEAIKIFKSLIYSPEHSAGSLYLRDFSIVSGVKLQMQLLAFPELTIVNKEASNYINYKSAGYDDFTATNLALHDLSKSVSPERINDIANTSNMIVLESLILATEKGSLKSEVRQNLFNTLGANLSSFEKNELKPLFFQDNISANIEPLYHYATGYDAYHSFDKKLTPEMNTTIDDNYEKVIETAKQAPEFKKNIVLDQVLFYNQLTYLSSIDRRYGSGADVTKINSLADNLLANIRSSKEMSSIAAGYFIKSTTAYGPVKYFLSLGKTNRDVAEYLSSIGITSFD